MAKTTRPLDDVKPTPEPGQGSRQDEERKQTERQTGGREDAGDDEDVEGDEGRGVESP